MFYDFCNNVLPAQAGSTIFKIDTKHFELKNHFFDVEKGWLEPLLKTFFAPIAPLSLRSLSRRTGAFFGQANYAAEMWVCCL